MDQEQKQDTAYTHTFLDISTEDPNTVLVPEAPPDNPSPILAQLAHLADPPPPPPPPPPMFARPPLETHKPSHSYSKERSQSYDLGAGAGSSSQQNYSTSAGSISTSKQLPATKPQAIPHMHSLPPLTTQNLSLRSRHNIAPASAGPHSTGGYGNGRSSAFATVSNAGFGNASASSLSGQSNIWARVTDKVRSSSRSRDASRTVERSPDRETMAVYGQQGQGQGQGQGQQVQQMHERSRYETFLPNITSNRARSPGSYSETGYKMAGTDGTRAPYETVYERGPERVERKRRPGTSGSQGAAGQGVMPNPKEIRAGMMGRGF